MPDQKTSELPVLTTVDPTTDFIYIIEDNGVGGYTSKQIKVEDFNANKLDNNDIIDGGTF